MAPWFAIAEGMATPCLFLVFFRFEDSVDGFGYFLQGMLIKVRPPSLELDLPKGEGGAVIEGVDRMVFGQLLHQGIQFPTNRPVIAHDQYVRLPGGPIRIGFIEQVKALS